MKTIHFAIVTKRLKYLGINLAKDVEDLYTEYYKALLKETEKDTVKSTYILWLWIGRLSIVKMTILPPKYTGLMQSPSKSR